MELPYFQSDDVTLSLLQTKWKSILNPILANQLLDGLLFNLVSLPIGATTINHMLGRKQVGWFITDINGVATIYRSKPLNDATLTLTSSAGVIVSIWMF